MKLLTEAIVLGIVIVMIGSIISFVISKFFKNDLPPVCKDWNKNYVMEISLFLTGFVTHFVYKLVGL